MPTVSHSTLTGADLHEPKGAASAASGTVYVSNGAGSGSWTTLASLTGTVGRIEMFATPVAPSGYIECNGGLISRTTFADLFTALTIQQTGSRTNGTTTITGLSDTTNMRVGYFIGGTGIPVAAQILNIPSSTSVTVTAASTSTGSGTIIVSPWSLGNGSTNFAIPNMLPTAGLYPRSRTSTTNMGIYQANTTASHTHTATSSGQTADHVHVGTTGVESASHTHSTTVKSNGSSTPGGAAAFNYYGPTDGSTVVLNTTAQSANHTHDFTTGLTSADHQHVITVNATGGTETRPETLCLMFCIKY